MLCSVRPSLGPAKLQWYPAEPVALPFGIWPSTTGFGAVFSVFGRVGNVVAIGGPAGDYAAFPLFFTGAGQTAATNLILGRNSALVTRIQQRDDGTLSLSTGVLAAATNPALGSTTVWNNAGVVFYAWVLDVTSTAAASGSSLLDLRVASVSKFRISDGGNINWSGIANSSGAIALNASAGGAIVLTSANDITLTTGASSGVNLSGNRPTGAGALINITNQVPFGDAAGTQLGVGIATSVNQSGTAGYTALRLAITHTAVGSGAKNLILAQVGGVTKFGAGSDGTLLNTTDVLTAAKTALLTTATWNNAAVVFTGWEIGVTSTASDITSRLLSVKSGGQTRFAVDVVGRVFGGDLHNNANSVAGLTPYIASGTYTPTLFQVTNVGGATAIQCQWMRVGNVVTVSGKVTVNSTAIGNTTLDISLPLASNLANTEDCAGCAAALQVATQLAGAILANTVNDRASMRWIGADIVSHDWYFTFTYEVL